MNKKICSFFRAPVSNVSAWKDLTWPGLFKILTGPPIPLKDSDEKAPFGDYFVRGIIKKNGERCDKALKKCNLVILDLDSEPLPKPKDVHKKLKKLGIVHAVHNTASPGRSRLILPVSAYNKRDSDAITELVGNWVRSLGINCQWASESRVKSQAWFAPQTTNGNIHRAYGLLKGKFVPVAKLSKAESGSSSGPGFSKGHSFANTNATKIGGGGKQDPLEKFIEGLQAGTIHQHAKAYAGFLRRTTDWTYKQTFDSIDKIIEAHYVQKGDKDKKQRWYSFERRALKKWYKEQKFQKLDKDGNLEEEKEEVSIEEIMGKYKTDFTKIEKDKVSKILCAGISKEQQLSLVIAPPNSGKTAIMFYHHSPKLADEGLKVIYIDAYSSADTHDIMSRFAKENGFFWWSPENQRTTVDSMLYDLSRAKNLKGYVIIIDTLKKAVRLMNKEEQVDFYSALKGLCAKGASVIALGHANKRMDDENRWQYEGTNEVLTECDSLVYLYTMKELKKRGEGKRKHLTVSCYPEKLRGIIKDTTYTLKLPESYTMENTYDMVDQLDKFVDVRELTKPWRPDREKKTIQGLIKDIVRLFKKMETDTLLLVDIMNADIFPNKKHAPKFFKDNLRYFKKVTNSDHTKSYKLTKEAKLIR